MSGKLVERQPWRAGARETPWKLPLAAAVERPHCPTLLSGDGSGEAEV